MPAVYDLIKVVSPLHIIGNEAAIFTKLIPFNIENTDPSVLMWVAATKNEFIKQLTTGIILCEQCDGLAIDKNITLVVVANVRAAFRLVLEAFYKSPRQTGIHPTAIISSTAILGDDFYIGAYAVIEDGCTIGNGVSIGHHTVIGKGTVIEEGTIIGTNCSIGGDGFGYEKDDAGHYIQIPHIGYVHLKDNVDIGNNVCIDRGTLGVTLIGSWSRIDNLVHIAHNVQVGTDTLIIAQSMIAGSCQIGNDVWIAPCAAILNKVNVAHGAKVGMGAMVFKNVNEGETVIGNPARATKTM